MDGLRPIAVAGTHGKTTTTSMLAVSLSALGLDPSYAIGGDLDAPGSNAHHGEGDIFVAEADESDRSFHKYAPQVAIILNAELDHHANYASIEEIYESFETFVARIVPGGTLVVAHGQEGAAEIARRVAGRQGLTVVTYGEEEGADIRITKVTPRGLTSEVTVLLDGRMLTFTVSVPGRHYAHNAVAALAAGVALGIPAHNLASALGKYTGVKRRLQLKGEAAGVQVIDSYAHHPTEMNADLEAIRGAAGDSRILVVFQPHLFSRTQELGKEMGQALALADASVVLDIYPAREDRSPASPARSSSPRPGRRVPTSPPSTTRRPSPTSSREWPSPAISFSRWARVTSRTSVRRSWPACRADGERERERHVVRGREDGRAVAGGADPVRVPGPPPGRHRARLPR